MLLKPSTARLFLATRTPLTTTTSITTANVLLARRTMSSLSSAAEMMSNQHARLDLAKEITVDHDNVRDLLDRYKTATEPELKKALASTLIREMAVHGDAEEVSAYNVFRKHGLGALVDHDLEEHHTIKQLAYKADTTLFSNEQYDEILIKAAQAFITHAEEEEKDQLPQLVAKMTAEENDAEARKFLAARKAAPERPHPLAPQSGGVLHKAAAMQSKIHDKIITSLQGREYVDDLRYKHGAEV